MRTERHATGSGNSLLMWCSNTSGKPSERSLFNVILDSMQLTLIRFGTTKRLWITWLCNGQPLAFSTFALLLWKWPKRNVTGWARIWTAKPNELDSAEYTPVLDPINDTWSKMLKKLWSLKIYVLSFIDKQSIDTNEKWNPSLQPPVRTVETWINDPKAKVYCKSIKNRVQ